MDSTNKLTPFNDEPIVTTPIALLLNESVECVSTHAQSLFSVQTRNLRMRRSNRCSWYRQCQTTMVEHLSTSAVPGSFKNLGILG